MHGCGRIVSKSTARHTARHSKLSKIRVAIFNNAKVWKEPISQILSGSVQEASDKDRPVQQQCTSVIARSLLREAQQIKSHRHCGKQGFAGQPLIFEYKSPEMTRKCFASNGERNQTFCTALARQKTAMQTTAGAVEATPQRHNAQCFTPASSGQSTARSVEIASDGTDAAKERDSQNN